MLPLAALGLGCVSEQRSTEVENASTVTVASFKPGTGSPSALLEGRLTFDETGCVRIKGVPIAFSERLNVSAINEGGTWQLLADDGKITVGATHDRVSFGGGVRQIEDLSDPDINFAQCEVSIGDTWMLVNEVD